MLDLSTGSIAISGKRSSVKKAKDQVYGFLDFLLPGVFERIKITKPLFLSVGQASVLAEISAAAGGVAIYLDRDLGLIVIRSDDKGKLQAATKLLMDKIMEAERLAYVLQFSSEDSWILPEIIGKNGSKVSSLRSKHPSCKIDVSKEARTVTVVGDTEEAVHAVRDAVESLVEKTRNENTFVHVPEAYVSQFVGKGGSNVKALSASHGAEIHRIKKGHYNFKIMGEESKVQATKVAIDDWLSQKEEANAVLSFHLEKVKEIQYIIGEKGEFIRSVQEEFKCKVDVDKKALIVNVKGDSAEIREAAVQKFRDRIVEERGKLAQASKENNLLQTSTADTLTSAHSNCQQSMPETVSNEGKSRSRSNTEESVSSNEFPSKPVGIASAENASKGKKQKQLDASIHEGTEEGKSLFAMLLADD